MPGFRMCRGSNASRMRDRSGSAGRASGGTRPQFRGSAFGDDARSRLAASVAAACSTRRVAPTARCSGRCRARAACISAPGTARRRDRIGPRRARSSAGARDSRSTIDASARPRAARARRRRRISERRRARRSRARCATTASPLPPRRNSTAVDRRRRSDGRARRSRPRTRSGANGSWREPRRAARDDVRLSPSSTTRRA